MKTKMKSILVVSTICVSSANALETHLDPIVLSNQRTVVIPVSIEESDGNVSHPPAILDNNLQTCINDNLGKYSNGHSYSQVYYLDCRERNIHNISGIQRLNNLSTLRIGGNYITDLSALTSLSKLSQLFLNHSNRTNKITNASFAAISSMRSIVRLDFNYDFDNPIDFNAGGFANGFEGLINGSSTVPGSPSLDAYAQRRGDIWSISCQNFKVPATRRFHKATRNTTLGYTGTDKRCSN